MSYGDEVLSATTDGNGNVKFGYAKNGNYGEAKSVGPREQQGKVTYTIQAGAVNGQTFNIDWSKVNSISGQTYSVKNEAKANGLKWDSKSQMWIRKK